MTIDLMQRALELRPLNDDSLRALFAYFPIMLVITAFNARPWSRTSGNGLWVFAVLLSPVAVLADIFGIAMCIVDLALGDLFFDSAWVWLLAAISLIGTGLAVIAHVIGRIEKITEE